MENPIKQIYRFNKEAGLLDKGYNDFLESSFQVEEALESLPLSGELAFYLYGMEGYSTEPKDLARAIVAIALTGHPEDTTNIPSNYEFTDVARLDKACDAVVFAVGSMAKLGLNPQQITRALNIVMQANFTKLAMPKDSHGKLTKPADFTGPEPKLQEILNERS